MRSKAHGFVYLDIIVALFIFGLGFAVIFGSVQASYLKQSHTERYLDAVNLASSTLNEVVDDVDEDPAAAAAYLEGEHKHVVGFYNVVIKTEWAEADLLSVTVEVTWLEQGRNKNYHVQSLCHVPG
ncbi:hypothetical protein LPY66_12510 [Dehalobacter sp. DCM]|uniref:type IV pilus modification PilV family protein n=1 Tax=Dehalobacter sp. DCM TaxID=2907827 RepID=UPI0030814F20|nr:hypothetical protein LPY66_12510 [Dehalobacter sp. DCM]